ncbi:MAG: ATP-binding protein [Planctomycetes bacterium]|nr:ATP-binding protein [Planctomycetota bacterium]
MKRRSLDPVIDSSAFADHKIAMVSGPRQCGKTTLARMMLAGRKIGVYRNWDQLAFRREWSLNPSSVVPAARGIETPLVVLDEIHKERRWKRNLKGIYDTLESPCDFLVTGSARLNIYRKGSDSLLGRHYAYRMHPFSIRELDRPDVPAPDRLLESLFARAEPAGAASEEALKSLMTYGPFPEPLFSQNARRTNLWRRNREQLVIREDLRDLSRLPELDRVEMLAALLPGRVGSLFSYASLGRDLETSVPTVKRWMAWLRDLYYAFEIKPWTSRIHRSLQREGKVYLWDYGAVPDLAAKFENLVALHLLKACHYWTDTGEGNFDLFFLRDKEKHEIDFLIVRDRVPWLPIEVKMSDLEPSPNWKRFAPMLPCRRSLQLVMQPAWKVHEFGPVRLLVAGAAEGLGYFA